MPPKLDLWHDLLSRGLANEMPLTDEPTTASHPFLLLTSDDELLFLHVRDSAKVIGKVCPLVLERVAREARERERGRERETGSGRDSGDRKRRGREVDGVVAYFGCGEPRREEEGKENGEREEGSANGHGSESGCADSQEADKPNGMANGGRAYYEDEVEEIASLGGDELGDDAPTPTPTPAPAPIPQPIPEPVSAEPALKPPEPAPRRPSPSLGIPAISRSTPLLSPSSPASPDAATAVYDAAKSSVSVSSGGSSSYVSSQERWEFEDYAKDSEGAELIDDDDEYIDFSRPRDSWRYAYGPSFNAYAVTDHDYALSSYTLPDRNEEREREGQVTARSQKALPPQQFSPRSRSSSASSSVCPMTPVSSKPYAPPVISPAAPTPVPVPTPAPVVAPTPAPAPPAQAPALITPTSPQPIAKPARNSLYRTAPTPSPPLGPRAMPPPALSRTSSGTSLRAALVSPSPSPSPAPAYGSPTPASHVSSATPAAAVAPAPVSSTSTSASTHTPATYSSTGPLPSLVASPSITPTPTAKRVSPPAPPPRSQSYMAHTPPQRPVLRSATTTPISRLATSTPTPATSTSTSCTLVASPGGLSPRAVTPTSPRSGTASSAGTGTNTSTTETKGTTTTTKPPSRSTTPQTPATSTRNSFFKPQPTPYPPPTPPPAQKRALPPPISHRDGICIHTIARGKKEHEVYEEIARVIRDCFGATADLRDLDGLHVGPVGCVERKRTKRWWEIL